jgi:hypothetical protein
MRGARAWPTTSQGASRTTPNDATIRRSRACHIFRCIFASARSRFASWSRRRSPGGAAQGDNGAATWLSELIWREFYFMILDHFPHVVERSFKPEYDAIAWEQGEQADAQDSPPGATRKPDTRWWTPPCAN